MCHGQQSPGYASVKQALWGGATACLSTAVSFHLSFLVSVYASVHLHQQPPAHLSSSLYCLLFICPSSPAHPPVHPSTFCLSTQNIPLLWVCSNSVVLNLWPPACLHRSHAGLHVWTTVTFSWFSLVHPSVCSFISLEVHLSLLVLLSASVSSAEFWVLVCPALLITKTLNPRPRDPHETKSPVWGLESSQPMNQRA